MNKLCALSLAELLSLFRFTSRETKQHILSLKKNKPLTPVASIFSLTKHIFIYEQTHFTS